MTTLLVMRITRWSYRKKIWKYCRVQSFFLMKTELFFFLFSFCFCSFNIYYNAYLFIWKIIFFTEKLIILLLTIYMYVYVICLYFYARDELTKVTLTHTIQVLREVKVELNTAIFYSQNPIITMKRNLIKILYHEFKINLICALL